MYLGNVWLVVMRRWRVVVAALVLVCVGCGIVAASTPPSYVSNAHVALVPPKSEEFPDSNRFLGLGGLDQSVDVLQLSMLSEETRQLLRAAAPGADYVVVNDPSTSAPILNLTASGRQSQPTEKMLAALLEQVDEHLRTLQSELGTPRTSQIVALVLSRDAVPQVNQKTRVRAVAAAAVGLLVMFFLLVGLLDGLLSRRSSQGGQPQGGSGPELKQAVKVSEATAPAQPLDESLVRASRTSTPRKPPPRRPGDDDRPPRSAGNDRAGV